MSSVIDQSHMIFYMCIQCLSSVCDVMNLLLEYLVKGGNSTDIK